MPQSPIKLYHRGKEMHTCRICGGQLILLGVLGNLEHSTCRNCGCEHCREVGERPLIEIDWDWVDNEPLADDEVLSIELLEHDLDQDWNEFGF